MSLFPPSIPGIFRGIERLATLSRNDAVDSGTGVPPVLFGLHLRVKTPKYRSSPIGECHGRSGDRRDACPTNPSSPQ